MNNSHQLSLNQAFLEIQRAFNFKLSPNQAQIIRYDYSTPTLINACAGSGKTTLLLFKILLTIVTGKTQPQNILAITFSKEAQLDMQKRYQHILSKLPNIHLATSPCFITFHALFYHILKHFSNYKGAQVLSNYTQLSNVLYQAIQINPQVLSQSVLIQNIFKVRSNIINRGLSYDGYHFNHKKITPTQLKSIAEYQLGISHNINFFTNYLSVIKEYCHYKVIHNLIDFNDMKVLLIQETNQKKSLTKVKQIMNKYQLCFIDEFQDIDGLQWKLMRRILPKATLKRLMVIGDDDQSIYGFRGSRPDIIINYTKQVPNAKQFNLSINYRTCGNALSAVQPLIQTNSYRMPKKLLAQKKWQGKIIEYRSHNKNYSSKDILLNEILEDVKNPRINNNNIVILTRYNPERMVVIDYLANHHIYVASDDYLQKWGAKGQINRIYQIFMNLINALYSNDFSCFWKCANAIGFNRYKFKHVQKILNYSHSNKLTYLSSYLNQAKFYNQTHKLYYEETGQRDIDVRKALKACQSGLHPNIEARTVFKYVLKLTKDYLEYMVKNHFMSRKMIRGCVAYFKKQISSFHSVYQFLTREVRKREKLEKVNSLPHYSGLHVMTIHKSKGLQFRHVFLYNFTNREVNRQMIYEDKFFTPQVNRHSFIKVLMNLSKWQMEKVNGAKSKKDFRKLLSNPQALKPYLVIKILVQNKFRKLKRSYNSQSLILKQKQNVILQKLIQNQLYRTGKDSELQHLFNQTFLKTKQNAKKVEEERRLIYVACTRAINSVQFNAGKNSNPLMYELRIKRNEIKIMNKRGHLVSLTEHPHHRPKQMSLDL